MKFFYERKDFIVENIETGLGIIRFRMFWFFLYLGDFLPTLVEHRHSIAMWIFDFLEENSRSGFESLYGIHKTLIEYIVSENNCDRLLVREIFCIGKSV